MPVQKLRPRRPWCGIVTNERPPDLRPVPLRRRVINRQFDKPTHVTGRHLPDRQMQQRLGERTRTSTDSLPKVVVVPSVIGHTRRPVASNIPTITERKYLRLLRSKTVVRIPHQSANFRGSVHAAIGELVEAGNSRGKPFLTGKPRGGADVFQPTPNQHVGPCTCPKVQVAEIDGSCGVTRCLPVSRTSTVRRRRCRGRSASRTDTGGP